jgi:hypothetical protein
MKAQDALEVHLQISLTSPLDEGEQSVPCPQPLYPWGQVPQFALDRRVVGPHSRYTLSEERPPAVENRTVIPGPSIPQPIHHTDKQPGLRMRRSAQTPLRFGPTVL